MRCLSCCLLQNDEKEDGRADGEERQEVKQERQKWKGFERLSESRRYVNQVCEDDRGSSFFRTAVDLDLDLHAKRVVKASLLQLRRTRIVGQILVEAFLCNCQ